MMFCHPSGNTSIVQKPLGYVAFPEYHQSGCQKDAPLPLHERCRNVFYLQNAVSTTKKWYVKAINIVTATITQQETNHRNMFEEIIPEYLVAKPQPSTPNHRMFPCVSVDGEKHCDCDYAPGPAAATCLGSSWEFWGAQSPRPTLRSRNYRPFDGITIRD